MLAFKSMFTGLVFKFLCTIFLYVFIVPSSVDPFIEYAWENQKIVHCFQEFKCAIHNINYGNSSFTIIVAVIVLHACCYIIDINDLQVEVLNIT